MPRPLNYKFFLGSSPITSPDQKQKIPWIPAPAKNSSSLRCRII